MSQDNIIPAEISEDAFSAAIFDLCSKPEVFTILEIGSSSGDGSTSYAVRGMESNPNKPKLFCLEVIKDRFALLAERYRENPQVVCLNMASVGPAETETPETLVEWHQRYSHFYPIELVLGWLHSGIDYLISNNIPFSGIEYIKQHYGISQFDVAILDGGEFNGRYELNKVYGARYILMDDIRAVKNSANYERLLLDPCYRLVKVDERLRWGFAIFERCPDPLAVDFFTTSCSSISGLMDQLAFLKPLNIDWRWHLLTGCCHPSSLTPASMDYERIASEFLQILSASDRERIRTYNPIPDNPPNPSAFLNNLHPESLLWQLELDEVWTIDQIDKVCLLFLKEPKRTAATFFCDIYRDGKLTSDGSRPFSHLLQQHRTRVWRSYPKMAWQNGFCRIESDGGVTDLALDHPFTAYDTARALVFLKCVSRDDGSPVDAHDRGATDERSLVATLSWSRKLTELKLNSAISGNDHRNIIIDAVCYQISRNSERTRFWHGLFKKWAKGPFAKRLVIIDRDETAPHIEGLHYAPLQRYDPTQARLDMLRVDGLSRFYGGSLIISTVQIHQFPSNFITLVENLWSEVEDQNGSRLDVGHIEYLNQISRATALLTPSPEPASALRNLHDAFRFKIMSSVHFGSEFAAKSLGQQAGFRIKYGLSRPFYLITGAPRDSRNTKLILPILRKWKEKFDFDLVALDSSINLSDCLPEIRSVVLDLDEDELQCAYSCAEALLYPSHQMGSGLSIIEAMQCHCPVITPQSIYLDHVGGNAALTYSASEPHQLSAILESLSSNKTRREELKHSMAAHVAKFDLQKSAQSIELFIEDIVHIFTWDQIKAPEPKYYTDKTFISELSHLEQLLRSDHFNLDLAIELATKVHGGLCPSIPRVVYNLRLLHRYSTKHYATL